MKSIRLWMLIIILAVSALAVRPVGEFLIRSEVDRRTGSQLSMDRCQFNMLTGGVAIDQSIIQLDRDSNLESSSSIAPIKIAKIWSRGSLNKLLYGKISAPITFMDGIEIESSGIDERQVPLVQPITPLVRNSTLLLANQRSPLLDELDQAFQRTKEAIITGRSLYDQINLQLEQIENRSVSLDNPLRDHEALTAAQQRLAVLQRELEQTRSNLDQNRDDFRQTSLKLPKASSQDNASNSPNRMQLSDGELADLKIQARSLAEYLVCSAVSKFKPYLGLSASMTRRCLMEGSRCEPPASTTSNASRASMARGVNYGFGPLKENELVFDSIRLRGVAMVDQQKLPFTGKMVNIGNQRLGTDDRPSMSLTFAAQVEHEMESPAVILKSAVIPDRQGFTIQCNMVPSGSMIASVAQGDWKLAAFGQNASVNLVWLVHQTEWSLVVDIQSNQSEVVVKRNALLSAPVQTELMPRYESCFEATESVSLAKARFQGEIEDGIPRQHSLQFESPFLDGLARSMAQQQRMILDVGNVTDRQNAQAAFSESVSIYQNEIDSSHRELVAVHEKLRTRLESFEMKMSEALPNRTDLRFSRENSEGILR
jgi:hypothetical protein